ncbi:peptidoglycan-binding domain-containing protein [Leptothoe kymatousa]|uniref:Peptidoglycan-binding protein n=1 Tax=Leptothoe kymatousa TAU-MAC 1615 TaxID=2364775 RepID=A0ABS5Y3T9_9CYAN|nr:peptidoglycan-binding protein [Leptothoe kymatousa]MBT9311635.1 peptidoglycan-binding protein [Leptothoe kymatousa TAU-MAC 1615]
MNITKLGIGTYLQLPYFLRRVSLIAGIWLFAGLPVLANAPLRFSQPILIAQGNLLDVSLRLGSSGTRVLELQRALGGLRLLSTNEIDGIYGEQTKHAVRQFQRIRRLDVTGVADAETLQELGIDPSIALPVLVHPIHGGISTDRLVYGSRSEDVLTLKYVLNSFGFTLVENQTYGRQTFEAVQVYQATAELPQTGTADRDTLLHMGFRPSDEALEVLEISQGDSNSEVPESRYVAAIMAGPSQIIQVRREFPEATVVRDDRRGEYISLGQFEEHSTAKDWVDKARNEFRYEAQVLWD